MDLQKSREMRVFLLRAATIPVLLATLAGGIILTRTDQADPGARAAFGFPAGNAQPLVSAGHFSPPRIIALMKAAVRQGIAFDDDQDTDQAAITWARRRPEFDASDASRATGGILQFGPMRIKRELVETVVRAARDTNTDPTLLMSIADKESSFAPGVKASTSSATGLFQFIDSTWLRVVRDFGAQHGLEREAAIIDGPDEKPFVSDAAARQRILALRNDPYLSATLAAEMLKHDAAHISSRIGRDLTGGETYLAHFLGPGDAEKFITKVVEEPKYAAPRLLPRPARANRSIFYAAAHRRARSLSVADVHRKFETMMGLRTERYREVEKLTGVSAYATPQ